MAASAISAMPEVLSQHMVSRPNERLLDLFLCQTTLNGRELSGKEVLLLSDRRLVFFSMFDRPEVISDIYMDDLMIRYDFEYQFSIPLEELLAIDEVDGIIKLSFGESFDGHGHHLNRVALQEIMSIDCEDAFSCEYVEEGKRPYQTYHITDGEFVRRIKEVAETRLLEAECKVSVLAR
jgi:hypothetical protein